MQKLIDYIKDVILKFKFLLWKIMNDPIQFVNFDQSVTEAIDINSIFTIIFEGDVIIVVYTNRANQKFPATPENVLLANKINTFLNNSYKI